MIAKIGKWHRPADNRNGPHPRWQFQTGHICVGRATRKSQQAKPVNLEMIGKLLQKVWPIEQLPMRLKT